MSERRTGRRKRASHLLIGLTVLTLGLTSCTIGSSEETAPPLAIDSNPLTELVKPQVTSNVANGAVGVSVTQPVTTAVTNGKFGAVTMTNPDGIPVAGAMSPDGQSWQSAEPLGYDRQYRLHVEAYGLTGPVATTTTFTTSAPDNLTKPYLMVGDNEVVGVGQPVGVNSTSRSRTGSPPRTRSRHHRSPGGGCVLLDQPQRGPVAAGGLLGARHEDRRRVNVYGKELGGGVFGANDAHSTYSIGDPVIITVDDNTLQVTVEQNGQVIRTMPTSMGKSGTPTDNGVYIIAEKHQHIIMDSSTYGVAVNSAEGYRTPVDYASGCPTAASSCTPRRGQWGRRAPTTPATAA